MRLPVGETPPLGEENVSPNEGGEEQRRESSEDKRESPREKAGEGAQEWDEEIYGLSGDLVGTVRDHTYNLRPNATLRQAYAIAWRNEQSLSMYDLGKRAERTMPHERDRRGRKGHAADDCYTKQSEERSCGGRRSRIEALEEELRKLKGEAEGSEEEED
ncbi:hypothetical protein CLOM_g4486 [Closterium sp. NIES-68]|nr:hypothetical protein CLOM_g4486 [Closterium sp. NIES-68]